LKESNSNCWDSEGNFLCGNPQDKEPTMQESIPECFDEGGIFLEAKCGTISIIRNSAGLINYITSANIDNLINSYENNSDQWVIDVNNSLIIAKQEIDSINNTISNIVYAPGTIASNGTASNTIIENGTGDLTPEISTNVVEGEETGDSSSDINTVVVEGDGTGDATSENSNVVVESN